jgi:hypothetical protein
MNAAIKHLEFAREEGVGALKPSSLLASQTQRIVDDVKFLVSEFTDPSETPSSYDQMMLEHSREKHTNERIQNESILTIDQTELVSSINRTNNELSLLHTQALDLNNKLDAERATHKHTNKLLEVLVDQSNKQSSNRLRSKIEKTKRKVKSILRISTSKNTV